MNICYINFSLNNPRDQITLRGLRENGVMVKEIADNTPGWRKYARIARALHACQKDCDLIMVGYAGGALVPLVRLLTRKKIIYNALTTFYDSMIVSRLGGARSPKSAWYYAIDFLSLHFADLVLLESKAHKELAASIFKLNPNKLSVDFVGADDTQFYFDPAVPKLPSFTIVFRGMFLPEAGAEVVLRAAKELEHEHVTVRIIGRGLLKKEVEQLMKELRPANVELITDRLPVDVLRNKMLECHLSLGQLADHPRVRTTIPHKAFESMAMKLPYLTGDNKGVMEVLKDGETCFVTPAGDSHALARKIIELRDRPQELERVAQNAYRLYQEEFAPKVLAQKIISDAVVLLQQ